MPPSDFERLVLEQKVLELRTIVEAQAAVIQTLHQQGSRYGDGLRTGFVLGVLLLFALLALVQIVSGYPAVYTGGG